MKRILVLVVGLLAFGQSAAEAAEPLLGPSVSAIFPAGGQRGTTVQFKVVGLYLHGGGAFEMVSQSNCVKAGDRIEATETVHFPQVVAPEPQFSQEYHFPREYSGHATIAADAPAGMAYWRVRTAQGITPLSPFMIGDYPEVIENEISGAPVPEPVRLPVTVNGRIYPREDVDVWSVEALKGQSVTCEVWARRISSTLMPRLEVRDENGTTIAENISHFGNDSFLRFVAPEDGRYLVHIHDLRYGGLLSSVYRLAITSGPYVDRPYPLGGRRGEITRFELVGQTVPDAPVSITLPSDGPRDFVSRVELDGAFTNRFAIDLSDSPENLEAEPNNDPAASNAFSIPGVINGRIDAPGDVDIWSVEAKQGQVVRLDFRARRPGSSLDPVLILSDSSGKELHRHDAVSDFTFPEDGTYHVRVEEMFGERGGPGFVYRLEITLPPPPPAPDFALDLGPLECALVRGGPAVEIEIKARRVGGLAGDIELLVDGLPEGVTAAPTKIPKDKNAAKIKLTAAKETRVSPTPIKILGLLKTETAAITRTATKTIDEGRLTVDTVTLATTMATPFKFSATYELPFALHGTIHYRQYTLERGGYEGPLLAQPASTQLRHQQGTHGPTIRIPAGATEFEYPINVSLWAQVGLTCRTVIMISGDIEENGQKHTVAFSSKDAKHQIIMQPNAGPIGITAGKPTVLASPDEPAALGVSVLRDPALQMPIRVELIPAAHVRGIVAEPIEIPVGESTGVLNVHFAEDAGPLNAPLLVRATVLLTETVVVRSRPLRKGDPVIAETEVNVAPARFRRF